MLHAERTRKTAGLYRQIETQRQQVLFSFGLFYVVFAVFITLSATWFGLRIADRMARPISRLAEAAQRIGSGTLSARVPAPTSHDEIAALSSIFNEMASEVEHQHQELKEARHYEEIRREFTENVLSGVPVGVIGVRIQGTVEVANRAAGRILGFDMQEMIGVSVDQLFPEIVPVMEEAREGMTTVTERNVAMQARGRHKGAGGPGRTGAFGKR